MSQASQAGRLQAGKSSTSKGPHQLKRQRAHKRTRTRTHDAAPEEVEYHFQETPLGLFESYFVESQQQHGKCSRRNNPGIFLGDSSESSELEVDDDDDTIVNHNEENVSRSADKNKRVAFEEDDRSEPSVLLISPAKEAEVKPGRNEHLIADHSYPASQSDDDAETIQGEIQDESEHPESDVSIKKPPFIPDHDLIKDRWYPDPWDRSSGQKWKKDVQNQHNLRAVIRKNGFTGRLAVWLFNQLVKRKGYRFPFNERSSLKKPDQTHAEYMAALRQRREEEHSYENQVKEYDEENALEEYQWTLGLYSMVYGPKWPEEGIEANSSLPNTKVDEDGVDGDCEEVDLRPTRRKTRQRTSTPEPLSAIRLPADSHGITMPPPADRASKDEIERRNMAFMAHKKRVIDAARKQREEEDGKLFRQSADEQRFSKGYRERWREADPVRRA